MGEKCLVRYQKHFADPVIHEQDLRHEELLGGYRNVPCGAEAESGPAEMQSRNMCWRFREAKRISRKLQAGILQCLLQTSSLVVKLS